MPKVDVMYLQEHKLRGDEVDRNTRMIWKRDNLLSMEASPSERWNCYVLPP